MARINKYKKHSVFSNLFSILFTFFTFKDIFSCLLDKYVFACVMLKIFNGISINGEKLTILSKKQILFLAKVGPFVYNDDVVVPS